MISTEMMNEQVALEEEMRGVTRHRYFKLHANAEEREDMADTHAGRSVFNHTFDTFLSNLQAWQQEKNEGKAGRKSKVAEMLNQFGDTPALAYIFVKHLLNTTLILSHRDKKGYVRMTRVALSTTQAIHDELRMRYFAENRKSLLRKIIQDFQQRDLPRRRRRELMIKQFLSQQLVWQADGWRQQDRVQLGIVLIDIFRQSTGMIDEEMVFEGLKRVNMIYFNEEAITALQDRMDKAANLFMVYYPTVIPPRPWSNDALVGGGYFTENVTPYKFVKGAKMTYLREMENTDLSQVLPAINAMQNTGWRVNEKMLDVLDFVYSNNISVKGLPPADPLPIPEAPYGVEDDEDIAKEYRKDCYLVHDANRRAISKRISILRTIALGRKFAEYPAIYFPYDVDSRGRAYPKVAFLNPQGPDFVKGILEFSEGKKVDTPQKEGYLAIAIANAWGQDKLSLADRVRWVEENEQMLVEVAMDPYGDRRWLQADEPFMALRGAMEWLHLCTEDSDLVSHMPVHFDATCSGLQHFSALLRDAEGGFYVNLTGHEERQDIYAEVARKATASIAADGSDIARIALEMGISRSLCKRPVMIVPYAGTFSACMDYVNEHYRERMEEGEQFPVDAGTIRKTITPYVAKHVWAAISSTVIAAREAMDWITHVARLTSKGADTPLQWTTPDGFVIQQAKYKETGLNIATYLDGGRRIRSTIAVDTTELDAQKMAQSLSPNFIHSLDACHMRGAIMRAEEIGGMSFAMIHDSFGVHAADMEVFVNECIKPAFVEMYESGNNLELFRKEITLNLSNHAEVKELPVAGTLDIHEVLDSQFFFS